MKLSIVTTMYNSAPYLQEFYERITKSVNKITEDYEIIFVDDGSPDSSLELAVKLHKQDSRVKVIELSRNFGHHKAIMAGLEHAQGDYTFLIDCDLEESPELLNNFWEKIHAEQCDMIYGVQEKRNKDFVDRIMGNIFYAIVDCSDAVKLPRNILTIRIMKQQYVKAFLMYQESHRYTGGIMSIVGFKQEEYRIEKLYKKKSTYTLRKKFTLAINGIVSFTEKPLIYIFNIGNIILIGSFLSIFYMLIKHFIYNTYVLGWASIIICIMFFGGLSISAIGIVGMYISRIFIEQKRRPNFIVRQYFGFYNKKLPTSFEECNLSKEKRLYKENQG